MPFDSKLGLFPQKRSFHVVRCRAIGAKCGIIYAVENRQPYRLVLLRKCLRLRFTEQLQEAASHSAVDILEKVMRKSNAPTRYFTFKRITIDRNFRKFHQTQENSTAFQRQDSFSFPAELRSPDNRKEESGTHALLGYLRRWI
jgi:hypothetical protein